MLVYLVKSMLCLLVLFTFYKIFLESEKAHLFKRFFLLGSIVLSLVLPLLTLTYTSSEVYLGEFTQSPNFIADSPAVKENTNFIDLFPLEYLFYVLGIIYLSGVWFFSIRFVRNIRDINRRIDQNEKRSFYSTVLVLLKTHLVPHTFLSYIFLNKKEYENGEISREIILHEKAHADQKHSLDLIFIELFQIIFWINPLIIWFKKAIKLNHEFLADDQVINQTQDSISYSDVLLQYAGGTHHVSLSSSINYSLTKKRIVMISKSFSIKKLMTKLGLFVPVLGCCIYFFCNDIVAKPALASPDHPVYSVSDNEGSFNIKANSLQEKKLKIRVSGNQLWVNGKSTDPEKFSSTINKITNNWTEEDLKNTSIEMKIENPEEGFMENLDREFSRTKLAQISGRSILPPPPPKPGDIGEVPLPPKVEVRENEIPHHPSPDVHLKEKEEVIRAENEEVLKLQQKLQEKENLSQEERKRIQKEINEKEMKLDRQMREVERAHLMEERKNRMEEREHMRKERLHPEPPKPPSPAPPPPPKQNDQVLTENIKNKNGFDVTTVVTKQSLDSKYPEDAVYYLNDEKINYEKAMQIIKEGKTIQVDIRKKSEDIDEVKIYI